MKQLLKIGMFGDIKSLQYQLWSVNASWNYQKFCFELQKYMNGILKFLPVFILRIFQNFQMASWNFTFCRNSTEVMSFQAFHSIVLSFLMLECQRYSMKLSFRNIWPSALRACRKLSSCFALVIITSGWILLFTKIKESFC